MQINLLFRNLIKVRNFKNCDALLGKRLLSSSELTTSEVQIPVPITGGQIAVQVWQTKSSSTSSLPPIICMHGWMDNSGTFDPLIPLLIKDGMTFVAVDQLGHGHSSHVTGQGFEFITDGIGTIHRVVRHFGFKKVIMLGHSYGSITSFYFTATNPDLVEKYIAMDCLHAPPRLARLQVTRTMRELFKVEEKICGKKQPSYPFEDLVQITYKGRKKKVTEEGCRILLKRGARPDPENPNLYQFSHDLKSIIYSGFGRFSYDESLQIASIMKCPVCVMKGEPGADFQPRPGFMRMVEAVRAGNGGKVDFHLIPGTHHFHLNDPNCVAPIINNFLEMEFQ